MLEAGKAAPTEFYRENQIIEWIYFSGLVFFLSHSLLIKGILYDEAINNSNRSFWFILI